MMATLAPAQVKPIDFEYAQSLLDQQDLAGFYGYLQAQGSEYAKLALGVVQEPYSIAGKIALAHLDSVSQEVKGHPATPQEKQQIMFSMAENTLATFRQKQIIDRDNTDIVADQGLDIHNNTFRDNHLPVRAWTLNEPFVALEEMAKLTGDKEYLQKRDQLWLKACRVAGNPEAEVSFSAETYDYLNQVRRKTLLAPETLLDQKQALFEKRRTYGANTSIEEVEKDYQELQKINQKLIAYLEIENSIDKWEHKQFNNVLSLGLQDIIKTASFSGAIAFADDLELDTRRMGYPFGAGDINRMKTYIDKFEKLYYEDFIDHRKNNTSELSPNDFGVQKENLYDSNFRAHAHSLSSFEQSNTVALKPEDRFQEVISVLRESIPEKDYNQLSANYSPEEINKMLLGLAMQKEVKNYDFEEETKVIYNGEKVFAIFHFDPLDPYADKMVAVNAEKTAQLESAQMLQQYQETLDKQQEQANNLQQVNNNRSRGMSFG